MCYSFQTCKLQVIDLINARQTDQAVNVSNEFQASFYF